VHDRGCEFLKVISCTCTQPTIIFYLNFNIIWSEPYLPFYYFVAAGILYVYLLENGLFLSRSRIIFQAVRGKIKYLLFNFAHVSQSIGDTIYKLQHN
jgi:hypothetical protein